MFRSILNSTAIYIRSPAGEPSKGISHVLWAGAVQDNDGKKMVCTGTEEARIGGRTGGGLDTWI